MVVIFVYDYVYVYYLINLLSLRYPPQLTGISIVQNVECPLTTTEKIGLSGRLKVSNGNGDGSLVFHLKRSVSSYATMEVIHELAI